MIQFDSVPLPQYFTSLFNHDVDYEEENPNYRCARGSFHVLNVAKFFIILDLIAIPIYLMCLFPWWIFFFVPHLLLLLVTLYALKKEKQRWMWPIVIISGVQFLFWCAVTVFKFIIGIFNTDYFLKLYGQGHHEDFATRLIIVVLIKAIVLLIGAVLFWRLSVFHATRKYLEAKEEGGTVDVSNPEDAVGLEKLMQPV